MKHTTITVVDGGGRPQSDARVALEIHQFLAGGMKGPEHTDCDGKVKFSLDIDDGAQITVFVDGTEKVGRGSVQSEYVITV